MFNDFSENYNSGNNLNEIILKNSEYLITLKNEGILLKKNYLISVEKQHNEIIHLKIFEKNYQKMFISTINMDYFNVLKLNQSLHVTFTGFIENLLKMLKECRSGKLQMQLIKNSSFNNKQNASDMELQFYEKHSFKNLVHLYIPVKEAPLQLVNFHLNQVIDNLQKQTYLLESNSNDFQNEIKSINQNLQQMHNENSNLRQMLSEQNQQYLKKRKQELDDMQDKINKLSESKELDELHYKKTINQLQSRIDLITLEKANAIKEKNDELKKLEQIRKDNALLKSNLTGLKQNNEQQLQEINNLQSKEKQHRVETNNFMKRIRDLEDKINKIDKNNSELNAELEAERQICHTKRKALELSTEEISKANHIISKQSEDVKNLNKKIEWRTAVALQQEKAIAEKECEIESKNVELEKNYDYIKKLQKNVNDLQDKLKVLSKNPDVKRQPQILSEKNTDTEEERRRKRISDLKKNMKI